MESLFIDFTYHDVKYNTLGGIYRHPNGNVSHFNKDLDTTLKNLNRNRSVILTGDINIDLIKHEDSMVLEYLTTLYSHTYIPLITLPS